WDAAAGVPVALKVTGLPPRLPEVAVRVFAPAVLPRVQLPTVAMPLAPVTWLSPVADPPPLATAKVTATPLTGFPDASLTSTLGAVGRAVATVAVWPSPAFAAIVAAGPAVRVMVPLTAAVSPEALSVRV